MEPRKPIVEVIACTQFEGIPVHLLPVSADMQANLDAADFAWREIYEADQDQGTDLERLIECAGRTCYDSSVWAHAWISFYIGNVSRGLTHELVRHGIGVGISQRSTRYVDESESEFIWHPLIYKLLNDPEVPREIQDTVRARLEDVSHETRRAYNEIVDALQPYLMHFTNCDGATARKQARGAARGALPNALATELVWSANVRTLRNVIEQRASSAADAEIRQLLCTVYEQAMPLIPAYLSDYRREECPDGIAYQLSTPYRKV
jgi:thymidylate synthase (FAD)